jgi:two-component system response regulator WspF
MRIAIVNDLALARAVLRRVVESVPGYTIAWIAADGAEAVRLAAADRPDVILMDLMMPVMDGATATRKIMAASPCPVLVVTASVGANFGKVYEALGAGGLDAVKTPTLNPDGTAKGGEALLVRLAKLAQAGRMPTASSAAPRSLGDTGVFSVDQALPPMLTIGASTGGPEALAQVLAALRPQPPGPVVVIQHIAADFSPGLATWLKQRTGLPAQLARPGMPAAAGHVFVAGSDDHLMLTGDQRFAHTPDPRDNPFRPSVDVFFESAARHWPRPGVAVLLTGMGADGARGLAKLRQRCWHTIAQDQATSVVYGMPRAAVECGAAIDVLPLPQIGRAVARQLGSLAAR